MFDLCPEVIEGVGARKLFAPHKFLNVCRKQGVMSTKAGLVPVFEFLPYGFDMVGAGESDGVHEMIGIVDGQVCVEGRLNLIIRSPTVRNNSCPEKNILMN